MMAIIIIAITIITLTPTTTNAQRIIRQWDDNPIISASAGWIVASAGDKGVGATVSVDQTLYKNLKIGFQIHVANLQNQNLHNPITLVGMDVALSYKIKLGSLCIQPKVFGGLGMVSHNTIMGQENLFDACQIQRQQVFLAPEAGIRIDAVLQWGKLGVGPYVSYTKQIARMTPTVTNLTVEKEWLTASPFEVGATVRLDLERGASHRGGNTVPIIGLYGGFGNSTVFGAQFLFSRNNGFLVLSKRPENLRCERIASTVCGGRFEVEASGNHRLSAMIGCGKVFHFGGPTSMFRWWTVVWTGFTEDFTSASTTAAGEANGVFGSILTCPAASGELSCSIVPFKNHRELDFKFTLEGGALYNGGTKVGGKSNIISLSENGLKTFYRLKFGLDFAF